MTAEEKVREDDVGVVTLDVELKCLDAYRYIDAFADPRKRQDALEEYAQLVSDAVREAFAIERDKHRDAAVRYIIDVSCEAKDFKTAEKLLAKIALQDNRQKAAQAISETRLHAMAE
jgi:hypothetical protein